MREKINLGLQIKTIDYCVQNEYMPNSQLIKQIFDLDKPRQCLEYVITALSFISIHRNNSKTLESSNVRF